MYSLIVLLYFSP